MKRYLAIELMHGRTYVRFEAIPGATGKPVAIRRTSWPPGQYIATLRVPAAERPTEAPDGECRDHLGVRHVPSPEDLAADDWEVVDTANAVR